MSILKSLLRNNTFLTSLRRIENQHIRWSSYQQSPFLEDLGNIKVKYEVTRNPEEWKFVERILPPLTVPEPAKKDSYPSGWKPQSANLDQLKYFVARTKNHMMPVYLKIKRGNTVYQTLIKKISGDIWTLEKELKNFLQKENKLEIHTHVNELYGHILIKGDYVNAVKYYLEKKQL